MPTTLRTTEIVAQPCPQCGFGEAVCEVHASPSSRFTTCPRCGFAEEAREDHSRRWKGHGVYVVECDGGRCLAGAFPLPIPDERVAAVCARFEAMGSAVRYVSRWNDGESRLEVLLGRVG